jgi:hypothetical protein
MKGAKLETGLFVVTDGHSLSKAYARQDALRVEIQGFGFKKYNDGFDVIMIVLI